MTEQSVGFSGGFAPSAMSSFSAGCVIELTVTADHHILDGAEVAHFLKTLDGSVGE